MPRFRGVDHVALTVTDLEVSTAFYRDVLGFMPVLDFGYGRILMHNPTGFTIGVIQHPEGTGTPFSELATGVDHIGFAAADRDELLEWQQRFEDAGVPYTPVRDETLGHHLNFRDPDGIALEFNAPTQAYAAALHELRIRDVPDEEILAVAEQLLGPELVARIRPQTSGSA